MTRWVVFWLAVAIGSHEAVFGLFAVIAFDNDR